MNPVKMNGDIPKNNGPNQVLDAASYTTADYDGKVKLRIPENGKAIEVCPPVSVPGLLIRTEQKYARHIALAYKDDNNQWIKINYSEYLRLVRVCAKAFLHLGLERHHGVCILGFNSPEWFISDLAAIFAGGIAAGIYTTNSSEACYHCAITSNANIVVVEDQKQLEKFISIRDKLPNLKAIIQYKGEPTEEGVLSWKDVMKIGEDQDDTLLDETLKTLAINECCTLVYTSGTVGNPKATMLSHDNLTFNALAISERLNLNLGEEIIVSYLPLSHVAAQVVDIYTVMTIGSAIYFADKNALKGSLVDTLKEVQPTKFLGVPRVYEKIYEKMQQVAASNGPVKRSIAAWAKNHALQHHIQAINGVKTSSWGYSIASSLVFKKIKQALGLGNCNYFVSAAAPLATDVKKYFLSIDIPIMECMGMSEAAGAHTICTEADFNLETIGKTIPGFKSKLHNPEPNGQGELCMYGRHIFMGYMNEKEKTEDTLDEEGWLHTGDLGRIDEKGFVYITGRLKELIITAGGENVAPVPIEQLVKAELPHVSNVFLVGDKRKFLSVLITLKTEVESESGKPLDTLLPTVQDWLKTLGCPAKTVPEVLQSGPDCKLLEALKEGIDRVNTQAVSNAQRIQKLTILPADFSVATGELGPTMKVKRRIVEEKYQDIINKMYE